MIEGTRQQRGIVNTRRRRRVRPRWRCAPRRLCFLLTLGCFGCSTARHGLSYDERLPSIRNVRLLAMQVDVYSIHAGGMREERMDLADEVRPRLLSALGDVVREGDRDTIGERDTSDKRHTSDKRETPDEPDTSDKRDTTGGGDPSPHAGDAASSRSDAASVRQTLLLATVVEDAIVTHHYEHSDRPTFEYTLGDGMRDVAGADADAVLLVRLVATVPTASRVGVAIVSAAAGALSGSPRIVSTVSAEMSLMLVDGDSGDVLWYDRARGAYDVTSEGGLRGLVASAARDMLKPWKTKN